MVADHEIHGEDKFDILCQDMVFLWWEKYFTEVYMSFHFKRRESQTKVPFHTQIPYPQ